LRVKLQIIDSTDRKIAILNADMGVPSAAMKWPYSNEVYQTFLLISFGYLSMLVTDAAGKELPQQTVTAMSATPALRPPIELGPGDSLEVTIPLGSFYQLESRKSYRVAIEYGDPKLKVSAQTHIIVP
jgi:hypothetical protein